MLVKIYGSAVFGVEATTITVEVNIDKGIGYHLVGLPDNAIKESSYRISAALNNNNYKLPGKKITINMAPADLRKEGSAYDLTLAIGILAASNQIKSEKISDYLPVVLFSLLKNVWISFVCSSKPLFQAYVPIELSIATPIDQSI